MKNFQDKKGLKHLIYSWPILILLGIMLVFFTLGVFRFLIKMIETSKNREIAELKVAELQETKKELTHDIENLKTSQGLEENIREKFGLAKEGEGLIIVVDNKENVNLSEETEQNWLISLFDKWFK
ncbi:hypothetical protein COU49_00205 [Candidatus Nomurabacteria bacterium CG10_big_fil_rev_8_21_14_0_10_35_16]|uniref:Septum formation initiator n=1 Tax=Candidatus Nomurabacteria bacterium CG10_big_fil_rev_8_21_14_0_10_35_16 TaxID=1974731 RepID=A0A2H0TC16_9BACT|nr:MAG: hypothetical protein COU49_00205 [Candidatus Nomurabacteria bacterium CG10_big_fil_rev_8_21_14_0_10_35_16]